MSRGELPKRREILAGVFAAALPFVIGASVIQAKGPFYPRIHDEYSNVFAADTFAHGRMTNPPHPFWPHFETFDVISLPTTMSRKPPGPGIFMALGQRVTGQPIWGSLLSVALAAAAIYWALLAWLPLPWALLGGVLAGTHPLLFDWSVNYWGGGVGVLGGALTLGAWRRMMDRPTPGMGATLSLGLALLANSRPFEGLIFALPLGGALAWRLLDKRFRLQAGFAPAMLSLGASLVLIAAAMGYYNLRVTGNPLRFPYMVYEEKYNTVPLFIGQPVKPVRHYLNLELDEFWNQWNRSLAPDLDTWNGYRLFIKSKFAALNGHWPAPAPLRLVFMAGLLGLSPPVLTLLMAGFVCGITLLTREPMLAHYSSPGGALFFLIAVMALRRLSDWRWRRWPIGLAVVAITLASCLFNSWNAYADYPRGALNPCGRVKEGFREHARIQYGDGKHLVFVRYRSTHFAQQGWIYNEADMDASSVIWARELSRDENCRLARYYKDRTDWLLKVAGPKADFTLVDPCR